MGEFVFNLFFFLRAAMVYTFSVCFGSTETLERRYIKYYYTTYTYISLYKYYKKKKKIKSNFAADLGTKRKRALAR